MSKFESFDGLYSVQATTHTIEADEIPVLIDAAGRILLAVVRMYSGVIKRDPLEVAAAAVEIYDNLLRIKKEVED